MSGAAAPRGEPCLTYTITEAEFRQRVRSNGKPDDVRTLPPPTEPMKVARELARQKYQLDDSTPTLRHWRGGWWQWRRSHWVEQRAARSAAYAFTEHAFYEGPKDIVPSSPNRHKIADLLEAGGDRPPSRDDQPANLARWSARRRDRGVCEWAARR